MQKKFLKICNAYLPVILWAAIIYFFSAQSSLPGFDVALYDYVFKKLSHMSVYAVLYFLVYRAINLDRPKATANWWLPLLFTFLYASVDELHQVFTPDRHPSPLDVGFDVIGASIVYLRLYNYI